MRYTAHKNNDDLAKPIREYVEKWNRLEEEARESMLSYGWTEDDEDFDFQIEIEVHRLWDKDSEREIERRMPLWEQ